MDQDGVPLAKPGDMTNVTKKYLNLGDMRLINNRWGSDALGCSGTQQSVMVNSDSTIGWSFNRPTCGGARGDPDFPEVEFGVAPFGNTSSLLTTPKFSSTTLLPIQIKDLTSANVTVDTLAMTFEQPDLLGQQLRVLDQPERSAHHRRRAACTPRSSRSSASSATGCHPPAAGLATRAAR